MRTSELTGAALDWAVAKCEGGHIGVVNGGVFFDAHDGDGFTLFEPTSNWAQGGPIIERTCASLFVDLKAAAFEGHPEEFWFCEISEGGLWSGPTPLIAAMRCYVASKLGDNIDIPEELK
jgi:hypothetical protein